MKKMVENFKNTDFDMQNLHVTVYKYALYFARTVEWAKSTRSFLNFKVKYHF